MYIVELLRNLNRIRRQAKNGSEIAAFRLPGLESKLDRYDEDHGYDRYVTRPEEPNSGPNIEITL